MLYAVLVVALVVLDQVVKFLVRANIPLGGDVPFLPHILHLTYVQNTGAAFSLLEEHTWILTIVSLVVSVLLVVLLVKKVFPRPFAMGRPVHGAGRGGGQPDRPGPAGLRHRHV